MFQSRDNQPPPPQGNLPRIPQQQDSILGGLMHSAAAIVRGYINSGAQNELERVEALGMFRDLAAISEHEKKELEGKVRIRERECTEKMQALLNATPLNQARLEKDAYGAYRLYESAEKRCFALTEAFYLNQSIVAKLEELAPIPTLGTKELVRKKDLLDKLSDGLRRQVDAVQEMSPALDETGLEMPRQDSGIANSGFVTMLSAVRTATPGAVRTSAEQTPEDVRDRIEKMKQRFATKG